MDVTGLNGDWTQGTATASVQRRRAAGRRLRPVDQRWRRGRHAGDHPHFTANSVTARGIQDDGGSETFQATAVCMFD
jgi:hypothetical protein